MLSGKMVEEYSDLHSWFHDRVVGNRALHLHTHVLQETGLAGVFAQQNARKVLDVGCGGGQLVIRLKTLYPHLQVTGIDLSAALVERAQARAGRMGLDARFEIADAQALPWPSESFDVVCSFGSVKHWPNPLQGIGECWRVLKAGGELLLTDNISDATREQFVRFYRITGFPRLLEVPVVTLIHRFMAKAARPMAAYHEIARQLALPPGTVTMSPYMPAFLFRTQKPASGGIFSQSA